VREIKEFSVYCPKVLLKTGNFSGTILDRGISINLEKKHGLQQSFDRMVTKQAADPARRSRNRNNCNILQSVWPRPSGDVGSRSDGVVRFVGFRRSLDRRSCRRNRRRPAARARGPLLGF